MATQIYKDHDEVLASIRRVQAFLEVNFITEGCREDRMFGCASCQAVGIHENLEMLAHEVEDDQSLSIPS